MGSATAGGVWRRWFSPGREERLDVGLVASVDLVAMETLGSSHLGPSAPEGEIRLHHFCTNHSANTLYCDSFIDSEADV